MASCLVVDDSGPVRRIVSRIVRGLGLEVREAADGLQALTACRSRLPDVVLLDWNMPVMDGPSFLRELRSMPGGGAPKVVFCTTMTEFDAIQEALDAGADEYVMKPFDQEIIRDKLEQVGIL
jgi:two-component system chemotaxis response regulator CheY